MEEWEEEIVDVNSVDWLGDPIVVPNVPAERKAGTKRLRVDPEALARAELIQIGEELGLKPRDIAIFLLSYAKPGPFQRGYLCQKYKLNKMLFYLNKELEKEGLGEALPHDEFVAAKNGPVPRNLSDDLKRLKRDGLMRVEGGEGAKKTLICELTERGDKLASTLWTRVPDPYLAAANRVKDRLFPLDPETIMERVHKDYPEFRETFTEPDEE